MKVVSCEGQRTAPAASAYGIAPASRTTSVPADRRRIAVALKLGLAGVVVVGAAAAANDFWASVLVTVSFTCMVVAGLHLLVQWAGQLSLGQVAFVGVGAFATATANGQIGLPLPLAILVGPLAAGLASAVVGLPALRIRGLELAIVTFAAGFAADRWLFRQDWFTGEFGIGRLRDTSLFGFDLSDVQQLVVPVAVIAFVVAATTAALGASGFGRALRLIAVDEQVASSYGINVGVHKFVAFLYAGVCAGLGGAGLALLQAQGLAAQSFPPQQSVVYLSAVLLGGAGPVVGSLAAGGLLAAAPILWGGTVGRYLDLIAALALFLTIRTFRGGINDIVRHLARPARWAVASLRH